MAWQETGGRQDRPGISENLKSLMFCVAVRRRGIVLLDKILKLNSHIKQNLLVNHFEKEILQDQDPKDDLVAIYVVTITFCRSLISKRKYRDNIRGSDATMEQDETLFAIKMIDRALKIKCRTKSKNAIKAYLFIDYDDTRLAASMETFVAPHYHGVIAVRGAKEIEAFKFLRMQAHTLVPSNSPIDLIAIEKLNPAKGSLGGWLGYCIKGSIHDDARTGNDPVLIYPEKGKPAHRKYNADDVGYDGVRSDVRWLIDANRELEEQKKKCPWDFDDD